MLQKAMIGAVALSFTLFMGGCSSSDDIVNDVKEKITDNDEMVTAKEFTQSLISANPWYWTGSGEGGEIWCNGTFVFDGQNHLSASWKEDGRIETANVPYSLIDGKLIIEHDGQVDTASLLAAESDRLITESEQVKPTETTIANYMWFVNKADAEAYLAEHGIDSCYP